MTGNQELDGEGSRTDCFLCRPSALLLTDVSNDGYTIAGLGPLCDGFALVATHRHWRGLAEAACDDRDRFAKYVTRIARVLKNRYGGCFLVEHGNTEICGIESNGSAHGFHPHVLLIPDVRCSVSPFQDYLQVQGTSFNELSDAISDASDKGAYLLVGQVDGPIYTFNCLEGAPRQLARGLVAEQLGAVHRASWRGEPNVDWSLINAKELRAILGARE